MSPRSYKIIIALLGLCVLSVLAVQAFWIRNAYVQKRDAFNRDVYSAMEQVAAKLQERDNLRRIEQTVRVLNSNKPAPGVYTVKKPRVAYNTSIAMAPGKRLYVKGGSENKGARIIITDSVYISAPQGGRKKVQKIITTTGNGNESATVLNFESIEQTITEANKSINEAGRSMASVNNTMKEMSRSLVLIDSIPGKNTGREKEIRLLIDKMVSEINVLSNEEKNGDTLSALIGKTLKSKGIFSPFAFSLRKVLPGKTEVIAQSGSFDTAGTHYTYDLSLNKVFSTNNFLWLQFAGQGGLVLAGMKGSLLLSALFSLVIIGVFYYTMLLIRRQKKLGEMRSDFINNMTHELKTPIATIALATDAIANPLIRNNDEAFRDYTRILTEEHRKLNSHVERVLQMAMLDKGEMKLYKKQVDIFTLVNKAVSSQQLQILKQNAVLKVDNLGDALMEGDEEHLLAVFNNLLDNALKYSKDPCVIEIAVEKANGELTVRFKDNGIGIDSSMKDKVFEKFYRAQGGNLHDVKGFGLGLSYVRSIVEAHGGSIALQSERGRGSEFIIRFKADA